MVAGDSVGPALILVCGICRDLRWVSELVNSIRDIDGFLGGSVRMDNCLSIYICLQICTGCSSVSGPISDALNLGIFRLEGRCVPMRGRWSFRDGYPLDSVGVVRCNCSVFGTDYIYYCSNSRRSSFGFAHLLVFSFSVGSVERFRYSKPSWLELPVSLSWFCLKIHVLTFSIRCR